MASADETRLRQVLEGLRYPAQKWQIVTWAETYGADATTKTELAGLPLAPYRCVGDVLTGVAGTRRRPPAAASDELGGAWREAS